jgi:antitoxin PrlF
METATLTSKGQLTVPKTVREALGVGPGDRIDFVQMDDGNYAILAATHPVVRLKGLLPRPAAPVSLDEMDQAIARGATGA